MNSDQKSGLLAKADSVFNLMRSCLMIEADLRANLFGESESAEKASAPDPSSLEGLLSRARDMAEELYAHLCKMRDNIAPLNTSAKSLPPAAYPTGKPRRGGPHA